MYPNGKVRPVFLFAMLSLAAFGILGCRVDINEPDEGDVFTVNTDVTFDADYNGRGEIEWESDYTRPDGSSGHLNNSDFRSNAIGIGDGYPWNFRIRTLPIGTHRITAYNGNDDAAVNITIEGCLDAYCVDELGQHGRCSEEGACVFQYTYDLSGRVTAFDMRERPYDSSTGTRYPSGNENRDVPVPDLQLFVFQWIGPEQDCRQNGGDDRLLGFVYTDQNGEWSLNATIESEIQSPNLYLCHRFLSLRHGVTDNAGNPQWEPSYAAMRMPSGQYEMNFSITCPESRTGTCGSKSAADAQPSYRRADSNILLTAIESINILGTPNVNNHTNTVLWRWPVNGLPPSDAVEGVRSNSVDIVQVGQDDWKDIETMGRYLGCLYLKRLLNVNRLVAMCPQLDPWYVPSPERCATALGWAQFVSALLMFPLDASAPKYDGKAVEGRTRMYILDPGIFIDSYCLNINENRPRNLSGNVTRFFWDLCDTTQDGDTIDNQSLSLTQLFDVWRQFPPGTADHEADEASPPTEGRNLWDYWHNAFGLGLRDAVLESMMNNCLPGQEANLP